MQVDSVETLKAAFDSSQDSRLVAAAESTLFARKNALLCERSALEVVGAAVGVRSVDEAAAGVYIRQIDREIQKIEKAIAEVRTWGDRQ